MSLAEHHWPSARSLVEQRLTDVFREGESRAARYGEHFSRLWATAGDTVLGGKLVRPMLLVDIWEALATHPTDRLRDTVLNLAAAVELLHFSFLLHDDIIDGDLIRRGRPNLIGALLTEAAGAVPPHQAAHWAHTGGILMGDLMIAASHQAFARADLPQPQRMRILDLLDHTVVESVAGEQTDVGLADAVVDPQLPTILAMTSHKTATYTFELPLRMAAVLASSPDGVEDRLGAIGRHLGLGFQLQDDLLSAFGDPGCHGKDEFSDLREGKQTAIIAHARSTEAWPGIEALLGRPGLSIAEATQLAGMLTECGAQDFVERLVEEQLRSAHALVGHELPVGARHVLLSFVDQLRGRRA